MKQLQEAQLVQPAAQPLLILAEPRAPVAAWLGAPEVQAALKWPALAATAAEPAAEPEMEDAAGEQSTEELVRAQPASAAPVLPVVLQLVLQPQAVPVSFRPEEFPGEQSGLPEQPAAW